MDLKYSSIQKPFLKVRFFLKSIFVYIKTKDPGFPGGTVVENLPANAGDMGSSPGPGGSHMPRSS